MVNIDRPGLALAMETGIGLLVEFEAPIGAEPDDGVAAELKIKAVGGGTRGTTN
jgi:hypothetical protein